MRVIVKPAEQYCDIVAVPVVTLRPSIEGTRPDPGSDVVMTSDGRYYTSARGQRQVLEWAADGSYVRAVGKEGGGPGEFAPSGLLLFLDANDSLFVLDGNQRWTVFSPSLEFRRTFVGRFNGRRDQYVHVVSGHGIVTTGGMAGADPAEHSFHVMNFDGSPSHSFGPVMSSDQRGDSDFVERVTGFDDRDSFWVSPTNGHKENIVLQRWTLQKKLAQELELRVPWFPEGGYDNTAQSPVLPEYDNLVVDKAGLLWLIVIVRDPRWRPLRGEEQRKVAHEIWDARVEVIDPATGIALAAYRHDGPNEEIPPFVRFFPGTRRAYRDMTDSLGFRSIEIYDIHLVPKR